MSFTVQYLPLNKIKPDLSGKMNYNFKMLRNFLWDCMHLMAVEKNPKEDHFFIVSGHERYEYLSKHTTNRYAPCIVLNNKSASDVKSFVHLLFPHTNIKRVSPAGWSILRTFLKREPRFSQLSLSQQVKVLLIGIRYKKTVLTSMKEMVDDFTRNK